MIAYYIDFNSIFNLAWAGVFIGLLIAVIKGYLVAANFMHLNNEKKMIYWILILTVSFLVLLFFMPILWESNLITSDNTSLWDDAGAHQDIYHGDGH